MPVITNDSNDLGMQVVKRAEQIHSQNQNWTSYYDQIAKYYLPKKDNIYGQNIAGTVTEDFLYDNTSVHVNELLASAMHGMLTNPASTWFGFGTGINEVDSDDEVQKWSQETAFRQTQILNNSNFQTQVHEYYMDLGSFGTGVMKVEEDKQDIVRFESRPIYEYQVAENNRGVIDTVYRTFKYTFKQIVEKFGEKNLDEETINMFKKNPTEMVEVIHAIEPRSIQNIDENIPKRMPFRSVYVIKKTKKVLKESGFKDNPYVVARWSKISGEVLGRSPAMKTLSDTKMLNAMMKVTIQAGQIAIAPPVQVPDDGVLLPIKMNPLGVNMYRAGSKDRIETIPINARPDIGLEMMENVRQRIRQGFFIDQLQLAEDNPQMTATEVLQRTEEKLRLMSPILGRQQNEFLEPLISRVFRMSFDANQFDDMPSKLQDALKGDKANLQVKYISQIAKAQRTGEADNFGRFIQIIAPMMESQPEMLRNINGDELVRRMAEIVGVHHSIIRDRKEVEEMKEQEAQQQEQQQSMDQGVQASQIQKNIQG